MLSWQAELSRPSQPFAYRRRHTMRLATRLCPALLADLVDRRDLEDRSHPFHPVFLARLEARQDLAALLRPSHRFRLGCLEALAARLHPLLPLHRRDL